jgi:hypothetical protein
MKKLSLCAVILAFILGCGNEPGPGISPEVLFARNGGEGDYASGSCTGPFISELKPSLKSSNYSTELFLGGTNKPLQAPVSKEICNELSRYLSSSTWMENGYKIENDVDLTINFGSSSDNSRKAANGGGIRAASAELKFLDGSLTQKSAHVALRCPALFSLHCPKEDSDDCFDYTISFGHQKCTFSGLVGNMVYSDHKRSTLEIFGEITFNNSGSASMVVTKASWMMFPEF